MQKLRGFHNTLISASEARVWFGEDRGEQGNFLITMYFRTTVGEVLYKFHDPTPDGPWLALSEQLPLGESWITGDKLSKIVCISYNRYRWHPFMQ